MGLSNSATYVHSIDPSYLLCIQSEMSPKSPCLNPLSPVNYNILGCWSICGTWTSGSRSRSPRPDLRRFYPTAVDCCLLNKVVIILIRSAVLTLTQVHQDGAYWVLTFRPRSRYKEDHWNLSWNSSCSSKSFVCSSSWIARGLGVCEVLQ